MKRIWSVTLRSFGFLLATVFLLSGGVSVSYAQSSDKTLVVAVSKDLQNIDPTMTTGNIFTWEFLTNVYDWLIDYDVVDVGGGKRVGDSTSFIGGLAESWEWNEDGTVVTFHLREGMKFSNGDPLDAEAVKFTFDRIFDQQGVTVGNMSLSEVPDKQHVRLVDSLTIEITLDKANSLLFGNMAQAGNSILNPKVVGPHMTADDPSAHEWLITTTQGTESGAFRLEKWDHGDQYSIVRNENYSREPAKLDRVIFKVIPDPSSRVAQLLSGAIDIATEVPTFDVKALEDNPDITVHRNTSRTIAFLGMNNKVPPFDNKLVRQAISWAIPYETIVNVVMNGYAIQLTSPIPTGTPTHTDDFFVYKNDPEKAKALLAEAGFADGFDTTLTIPIGSQEAKETAVFVRQSLGEIGVDVTIQELAGAAYFERIQGHDLDFFFANFWVSINNDPFYHLFWLLKSGACCNYADYENEVINDLIDKFTINTDEAAREQASREAQRIILDEAPWVLLYQPEHILAMRSNVKGYAFYSSEAITRYKLLYKE